jgi:hypothetical protein
LGQAEVCRNARIIGGSRDERKRHSL